MQLDRLDYERAIALQNEPGSRIAQWDDFKGQDWSIPAEKIVICTRSDGSQWRLGKVRHKPVLTAPC